jgi:membrane protease YdiL (CAAX protease family)
MQEVKMDNKFRNRPLIFNKLLFIIALPVIILLIQIFDDMIAYIFILALLVVIFIFKKTRKVYLLFVAMISGYLFWKFASNYVQVFCANHSIADEYSIVLSRFALCGYLLFFAAWFIFDKPYNHYFKIGDFGAAIQFPFIWKGFKDTVFRFSFIFSLSCVILACVFAILNKLTLWTLGVGLIFSAVNAVLEEFTWRGFVLSRLTDLSGKKISLLAMSLSFGLYHYSLGFSISTCFFFSLGGIYFGGVTLRSKGLLPAIIMHISMNILFVAVGLIF